MTKKIKSGTVPLSPCGSYLAALFLSIQAVTVTPERIVRIEPIFAEYVFIFIVQIIENLVLRGLACRRPRRQDVPKLINETDTGNATKSAGRYCNRSVVLRWRGALRCLFFIHWRAAAYCFPGLRRCRPGCNVKLLNRYVKGACLTPKKS